ncbi:MAG: hypothetical protein VZR64_00210 [Eubacterium sp.]|nr:hypothetical protein [Eubacterium sp.]
MAKKPLTPGEKDKFLDFLTRATPDELNEFIKKNGKLNTTNDRLFVFQWDNLKQKDE